MQKDDINYMNNAIDHLKEEFLQKLKQKVEIIAYIHSFDPVTFEKLAKQGVRKDSHDGVKWLDDKNVRIFL